MRQNEALWPQLWCWDGKAAELVEAQTEHFLKSLPGPFVALKFLFDLFALPQCSSLGSATSLLYIKSRVKIKGLQRCQLKLSYSQVGLVELGKCQRYQEICSEGRSEAMHMVFFESMICVKTRAAETEADHFDLFVTEALE